MLKNQEELRRIYGQPKGRAKSKVLSSLEQHSINFIRHCPFVVISTYDNNGSVDTSPRGGDSGFVHVQDNNEIVIPDSKGNNRIDSMVNILDTGRIGALFLIPNVDETLRINGSAKISNDSKYLDLFATAKTLPKTCIVIGVEEVFLHCAKALMRSKLWQQESKVARDTLPTMGQMLNDQLGLDTEPESQSDMVKRYQSDL